MEIDKLLGFLARAIDDKAIPNGRVWLCYRPPRSLSRSERKNMRATGFVNGGVGCWLYPPAVTTSPLWKRFLKRSDPYGFQKPKQRGTLRSSRGKQRVPIPEAMTNLSLLHLAQKEGMIPKAAVLVLFKPNRNLEDQERRQALRIGLASGKYGYWVFPRGARRLLVTPKGPDLMDVAIVTPFEQGKNR